MGVRKWLGVATSSGSHDDREEGSMSDVINQNANNAIYSMSNWLSGLSDAQVPMPSPNAANKTTPRKASEKSPVDFGQKLAKRRSQDFATKIHGWNDSGAGVVQKHDEIVVVAENEKNEKKKGKGKEAERGEVKDAEGGENSDRGVDRKVEEVTPTTPKTPASGTNATPGTPAARKPGKELEVNVKTSKEIDLTRGAWVRRRSKPQAEISAEVNEAVAPKKRIMSDDHWRRSQPPARKETTTPEKDKEARPKPVTVRRSVVSVGLKVPPSVQDFVETEPEPKPVKAKPLRRPKSRSRSRSREREATPDYEDSGVKVYINHRQRSKTDVKRDARNAESNFTVDSSFDEPSTGSTGITIPNRTPQKEAPPRTATVTRERPKRLSMEASEAQCHGIRSKSNVSAHEPPIDRKHFNSPAYSLTIAKEPMQTAHTPSTPVTPRVFGNRIEGWLAGMPDPFTEDRDPKLGPESLRVAWKKSPKAAEAENDEPQNDSIQSRRRSSARRQESRRIRESVDVAKTLESSGKPDRTSASASDPSVAGTPTLKRSGARRNTHSPVKDRLLREPSPTGDDSMQRANISEEDLGRQRSSGRDFAPAFPSTGKRLSNVAPVETFTARTRTRVNPHDARSEASDHPTVILEGSLLSRASDGDEPSRIATGLTRKLTKHSDLISVLSLPRSENPGVVSTRSIRTRLIRFDNATIGDLMSEITTDELKYQRELRTLVDGVIPVLLAHVLQKTDSAGAKRLFSGPSASSPAVTTPIVELGIALERLRSTHKRIPMHSPKELIAWAESAATAYADYLRAWRLGFQDLVVNLAPAEDPNKDHSPGWDHDLQRDKKADLTSGDGERVDVAYLLKRPLVRLKYLVKSFKSIDQVQPSATSKMMVAKYDELVEMARQRANDERARLEDEAAAGIDPTRARDPQSLVPLGGVSIDPTRNVRARDYFDLDLLHTTGQQLGCKIELIIRDDAPDRGSASDVLFCEVSTTGRWLLFPPALTKTVSTCRGDKAGEMLVMLRGSLPNGREWREVMSLISEDDGAIDEWLDMLPSSPVPSRLAKKSNFSLLQQAGGAYMSGALPLAAGSLREVEVPIGERAMPTSMTWDGSEVNSTVGDEPASTLHRSKAKRHRGLPSSPIVEDTHRQAQEEYLSEPHGYSAKPRHSREFNLPERPTSANLRSATESIAASDPSTPRKDYRVWLPSTGRASDNSSGDEDDRPQPERPGMHRRTSSVPSTQMPSIPKVRKTSQPATSQREYNHQRSGPAAASAAQEPSSAPAKLQKRRLYSSDEVTKEHERPAKPSAHTRPTSLGLRSSVLPSFTPAFLKRHRRSSSPLKHEYEPSTSSEFSSESDFSDVEDVESITSESSAGEEAISTIGELKDFNNLGSVKPINKAPPPRFDFSISGASVRPSDSASQAPFRHVPPPTTEPAKTVACIFSWSDRGSWDSLHPQECSIVVTPGLIGAFDLAQAHTITPNTGADGETLSPSARGVKPLVALELTPLVPLRRGTALDISIRSPPTANSLIRTGNNVMFRSRSPEECEKLYHLINRARIDNPTYIALQNARGPPRSNWAEVMDQRNAARTKSSSWLRLGSKKSSTYRSSGSRPASVAATESSVATMNSTFSALRRFSGGSRIFNIAKSTLTSREGSRSTYSDSLSSGAATPLPIDPRMGTPLGITNAKTRLYIRETASKWRDMGSARLTVMLPPRQDPIAAANPNSKGLEKRIIICGKSKGETLLDVTLGESAFERVARTGIAVSVWEEATGPNGELGHVGARGGVVGSFSKVYMIQMKSERDAAYTFGLVGKLRY